jgi:hypothetical protein
LIILKGEVVQKVNLHLLFARLLEENHFNKKMDKWGAPNIFDFYDFAANSFDI